MQVVQRIEPRPQDLVHALKVMQVGTREMAAGVARASLVERLDLGAVARVPQLYEPAARVDPAVARTARGQHAIEEIDAGGDRGHDVLRRPYSHEVARPLDGQPRRGVLEYSHHLALGLAHRQPADGVAVEPDLRELPQRLVAQRLVHAALHDAEERVAIALVRAL